MPQQHSVGKDRFGRTELHYAAVDADATLIRKLLHRGADPNLADADGWTPLHFAAQARASEIVDLLLNSGATVDAKDSHGNTPLFRAVFASIGDGAAIERLRAAGADPYQRNRYGVSPIALARGIANYDVAQYFRDLPMEA